MIGKFASAYMPAPYKAWQKHAVEELKSWAPAAPFDYSIRLYVVFYVPRPKTTKLAAPRGDIDNYVKSFMDAMTQAEFWDDDDQVVYLEASKRWAEPGSPGRTEFTLEKYK